MRRVSVQIPWSTHLICKERGGNAFAKTNKKRSRKQEKCLPLSTPLPPRKKKSLVFGLSVFLSPLSSVFCASALCV